MVDPAGAAPESRSWLRRFVEMSPEHPAKTVVVTMGVSLLCAIAVSVSAVLLKPLHTANLERERGRHILALLESAPGMVDLLRDLGMGELQAQIVELETGADLPSMDPTEYDPRAAAKDPLRSVELAPARDLAKLGRRPNHAKVYVVRDEGQIKMLILPVYGSGYASTLRGYLALGADANTILGLSFYEHAETPGMGALIDDPKWRASWRGKELRDSEGRLRIRVAKGRVDPAAASAVHEVDGLSGATLTGEGVTNLLRFWVGEDGFAPFLTRIRENGG